MMFNTASKSFVALAALMGTQRTVKNECMSQAEQQAAEELQRIIESNNGEMPSDPEEMQALLMRSRPASKRNPPPFERLL